MNPSPRHNPYLDWMRGVAALMVFAGHLRVAHFAAWGELDAASQHPLNMLLFGISRLGREGVILFFVLSGYLVGGQALARRAANSFDARDYAAARVSRLYTVLIPALVVTAAVDLALGSWTEGANGPRSFLVNLFLTQGILGPPYGSNVPLWTLSLEWWFYVLFGLSVYGSEARSAPSRRVAAWLAVAVIAGALWACGRIVLLMMPMWLLGAAVARLPNPRESWAGKAIALGMLLLAIGVSTQRMDSAGDYLVALTAAFVVYQVGGAARGSSKGWTTGAFLAAVSYTLYAMHFPLVQATYRAFHPMRSTHAGLAEWGAFALYGASVFAVCVALYWMFERNTPRVREWLRVRASLLGR